MVTSIVEMDAAVWVAGQLKEIVSSNNVLDCL